MSSFEELVKGMSRRAAAIGPARAAVGAAGLLGALACLVLLLKGGVAGGLLPGTARAGPRAVLDGAYPLASLPVTSECVHKVSSHYLDLDRARPKKMIARAVESLQRHVVPLLVRPELDDEEKGPEAIVVRLGQRQKRFELGRVADMERMLWVLMDIFQFIDAHLPAGADREELEAIATNGLLHTLDPHTTYLDPASYRDMQVETSGKFGGLGIVISVYKGNLTIISVMDGTPAHKAGLKPRDSILQIDDESTVNMDLSEAVHRLRGKPGAPVTVHVKRKGWQTARPFTVVRARIVIHSVVSRLLESKVAYVRLKNFRANTSSQLKKHLKAMEEEAGALTGVILDLRGDPGGFLEQAVRVSDLFLASGEIVRTIGAGRRIRDTRKASRADRSEKIGLQIDAEKAPLVVLIDGASASASEIVAGALKNRGRALVVGTKSFGKGTVQGIYDVGDGAVKVTIAEYLTPGGVPVHELGVVPDLALRPIEVGKDELLVFGHLEEDREESKADRKARKRRGAKDKPRRVLRFVDVLDDPDDEEARDKRRFQYDEVERDFAIEVAEALITEAGGPTADATFRKGGPAMERLEQREMRRLTEVLAKRGVDWSPGPGAAKPRLEADVVSRPGSGLVQAGEKMELTVRLRNTGVATLHRMHAVATSTSRLFDGREFFFGKLDPGEQRSWVTKIEPDLSAYSRLDPVTVEFYQDGKKIGLSRKLVLGVDPPPRPSFEFSYLVDDGAKGNGDGRLQRGEEVTLRLRVRNRGGGDGKETVFALKNEAGESVFLRRGRHIDREGFPAGEWYEVPFDFEVRPALTASTVPFGVLVRDNKHSTGIRQNVEVPVHDDTAVVGEPAGGTSYATADIELYGGASKRFPLIARLPRGTPVELLGTARSWVRVRAAGPSRAPAEKAKAKEGDNASGLVGWVRTTQLSGERPGNTEGAAAVPAAAFRPPEIQIEAPAGAGRHVDGERAVVRGQVVFHRAGRAVERAVTVYVGRRKVWFDSRRHVDTEPLIIPVDLPVELEPGPNRITIRAIETDRIEVAETLFIHREENEK